MDDMTDGTVSRLMRAARPGQYVIAAGRGRRAAVWLCDFLHGRNLTVDKQLSGIEDARRWAKRYAEKYVVMLVHAEDITAYRRWAWRPSGRE